MHLKTLMGAIALTLMTANPSSAAQINLDFSFGGLDGVSGTFFGLDNAITGPQAASGFTLVGTLETYTSFDVPSLSSNNSFILTKSGLVSWRFYRSPFDSPVISGTSQLSVLSLFANARTSERDIGGGPYSSTSGPPTFSLPIVPLPASALFLLTALASVAVFRRRQRSTA